MRLSKIHAQGFLKDRRDAQTNQWSGREFEGKRLDEIQINTTLSSQGAIDQLLYMLTVIKPCLDK